MKVNSLRRDTRPQEQAEGSYPYGKNGVHDYYKNAVMNEPGFEAMAAAVPYTFMGLVETDDRPVLFSTDNTSSAIGFFDPVTELYVPIVDDRPAALVNWPADGSRLDFDTANFITGESQRNYKAQLVVSFTDKITFPKYLNCDAPNISKLSDLRLFPLFNSPNITLSEGAGGILPEGSYFVAMRYEKEDGTATPISEVSDGFIIPPSQVPGRTDKALLINVSVVDTDFDYIRFYVISRSNGITSAKEVTDPVRIASGDVQLLYTGNNLTTEITLSEILTPSSVYKTVGTMGQLNDSLYIADLEKEEEIVDMQQYANTVQIKWHSELIDAVGPPVDHLRGIRRSFMHEEVYAVYIQYSLVKGGYTKAFITAGETPLLADLAVSTEATTGGSPSAVPLYKVDDRIHTFSAGLFSGVTGVWQNENEEYPDTIDFDSTSLGGRNLRGEKVLHHKMPSIRWCKANLYASNNDYGKTKLDILGLSANNVTIPAKYIGVIKGYRLLYAKRNPAATLVQGQSLLLFGYANSYTNLPLGQADIYSTGGNFMSNVIDPGGSDYDEDLELINARQDTFRTHAFDLLFNKPAISPTFISNQLKLRRNNIRSEGYINDGNRDENKPTGFIIEYNKGITPVVAAAGQKLRYIKSSFYLENGLNISRFENSGHEATFAGTLAGTSWPQAHSTAGVYTRQQNTTPSGVGAPMFEETFLVNFLTMHEDLYNNFYSQQLVSAGEPRFLVFSTPFFGGDTFVCDYTYHTYGRHDSNDKLGDGTKGKKVVRRFVCESASNIALRYEIPGNIYSKWFPRHNLTTQLSNQASNYTSDTERSKEPNQFGYSRDLNALNEFISAPIFNPSQEILTDFPFRIHRGGKLSRQSKARSWRTFLPLDYYECQKNMGPIINVDSLNDRLIIHHANALFRTQDKARLESGVLSVTLGTGDIFQFEPQMPLDTRHGYAGTQHELACVKIPPGYVFCDANQSRIFLLNDKLNDITEGLEIFLDGSITPDINVFIGSGVTIGWDDKFGRILFTNKDGANSFTLSYNILRKAWAFFHDYTPDMYITTRNQLFSVKDDVIYKHNAGPYGQYYDDEVVNPFFIDVIFRAQQDMILETVNWQSAMLDSNLTEDLFGTLSHISIWNSHQHSGRIALSESTALKTKQMKRTLGQWSFNEFRNILTAKGVAFLDTIFNDFALTGTNNPNAAWYKKETMNDNWFCVRFELDNVANKQLVLHDTSVEAQISIR